MPIRAEHVDEKFENFRLIIDDENRPPADSSRQLTFRPILHSGRCLLHGQFNHKDCSRPGRLGQPHGTSMAFDDPLAERQAEPGAFPGRFGGEKGVENPRSDLRRDAGPRVGHLQANQRSRRLEP